MKRFNVTAVLTANFIVDAKNEEEARAIALGMPSETEWELTDKNIPTKINFEIADIPSVKCCDLMDTSNGHNKELVRRINKAYGQHTEWFIQIVRLLAERDVVEFVNTINRLPQSLDNGTICHEYCQRIADNTDLAAILEYCRM